MKVECPFCKEQYEVKEKLLGKKGICKMCERTFVMRGPNGEVYQPRPNLKKGRNSGSTAKLVILIISLVLLFFALIGGGAFYYLKTHGYFGVNASEKTEKVKTSKKPEKTEKSETEKPETEKSETEKSETEKSETEKSE